MNLALVQPLYRARISRECKRISIEGTERRCMGRRYWPARTALSASFTEIGFTFINSSCPQLLDNMNLALVQPLYRARISRECTRISIQGTIRRCMGRRYWLARTALCAFCTEKGFTFINSSYPQLLDDMNFALVQPLYRARISRECKRISIEGTERRCMGRRYWPARTALSASFTEIGFSFINSSCPQLLDNMNLALVQPLYRAKISRECTRISIQGTILYGAAWDGDIGWLVQLCAPFAPRKGLHL